jgi:hypothetical protein
MWRQARGLSRHWERSVAISLHGHPGLDPGSSYFTVILNLIQDLVVLSDPGSVSGKTVQRGSSSMATMTVEREKRKSRLKM